MISETYLKEFDKENERIIISFEGDKDDVYALRQYAMLMNETEEDYYRGFGWNDEDWSDEDLSADNHVCEKLEEVICKNIDDYGLDDCETTPYSESDMVNHPPHYTNSGMECIDEMIMIFGEEAVMNFCLCNCWKYRKRALDKGGRIDLEKSDWYVAKYKELKEIVQNKNISKHDKFVMDMRKLLADGASLHLDEPEFARLYKKLFPLE